MKRLAFAVLMLAAGMAWADDLGDAEKALRAKEYDKALPIYTKLANAGNAEAQFRLGEMYWYGDGTAVDMGKSQAWLQKAAASGHGGAKESLAVLREREQRAGDLAYWTGYKGDDLVTGKYACPMPKIPQVSKTNEEINRVSAEIAQWETCYNDFVAGVNQAPPGVKRIPADILKLMSPHEAEQAASRIDDVTVAVVTRRQAEALNFTSERDAWYTATQSFVAESNAKSEANKRQLDVENRRAADASNEYNRRVTQGATFATPASTGK